MVFSKMMCKRVKQVLYCIGMVLVMFFFSANIEASSRRSLTNQELTEGIVIQHRQKDLYGNFFDIYINNDTEVITIQGEIEVYDKVDWDKIEKIKQYFNTRNPGDYEFVYKFKFVYNT